MGKVEGASANGVPNLQQKIGTLSRPPLLLGFIHSPCCQEIGRPFGDRGSYPQSGTEAFGVVNPPVALVRKVTNQCLQNGLQLSRGRDELSATWIALKKRQDGADMIKADPGILALSISDAPVRPLDFATIIPLAATRAGSFVARVLAICFEC